MRRERRDDEVLLGRDTYKLLSAVGGTATVLAKHPENTEYAALVWLPLLVGAVASWEVVR